MIPWRLYLVSKIVHLLPETRAFALKRLFYRWAGAVIGQDVNICSSVTILGQGPLAIGDHVWIGPQTMIMASAPVNIGSHVDIAPRVYIGTGTHEIDETGPRSAGAGASKAISIGDGVWIGAMDLVLPDVIIGGKSVIAAGAVVTRSVPERVVAGGVPARIIRSMASEKSDGQ